jgi:4-methyl-5(b-hydroxyethyl)-thiazole monophosphate biosynthesis
MSISKKWNCLQAITQVVEKSKMSERQKQIQEIFNQLEIKSFHFLLESAIQHFLQIRYITFFIFSIFFVLLFRNIFFTIMKVFIFLANGFEETEAIATIDVLRRGGLDVTSVSISGTNAVEGAHGIKVFADKLFTETDFSRGVLLVLPGGMPGAANLNAHSGLKALLKQYATEGKKLAAICAAPLVLGGLDLLQGKQATAYPGFEDTLRGATFVERPVVTDGNIITGRGPGFALNFGLAIVEALQGKEKADEVAAGLLLK